MKTFFAALLVASASAFAPACQRQAITVLAANPNPFGTPSLDVGGGYVGGWTPPAQQSSNAGPAAFTAPAPAPAAAPAAADPYADNPYAAAAFAAAAGATSSPAPVASSGAVNHIKPLGPVPPLKSNPNHIFDPMRYVHQARPAGW